MTTKIKLLPGITELQAGQELREGGHNWPDMYVVIDTNAIKIEDNELYLLTCPYGRVKIKRVGIRFNNSLMLHPAIHSGMEPIESGPKEINLLGKKIPIIGSMEFSEGPYKPNLLQIHGKVVGLWAGGGYEE